MPTEEKTTGLSRNTTPNQGSNSSFSSNLEQILRRHKHDGIETEKLNDGVERIVADFNTGEQYSLNLYVPFAIKIIRVRGRTIEAIAATDDGTITVKDAAGNTTATLTASASTAINTDLTAVVPSSNNLIAKDSYYQVVVSKVTAGGKAMVSIEYERL